LTSLILVVQESASLDLSKAVQIERTYGLQMNVKESIIESARQGALEGFSGYDASHDVSLCRHCPDNLCIPPNPLDPIPPNICDPARCEKCFREKEARKESEDGAIARLNNLKSHEFDPDFFVSIRDAEVESFLKSDPLSKNGFALDFFRFKNQCAFSVNSEKFSIESYATIPKGLVIFYD